LTYKRASYDKHILTWKHLRTIEELSGLPLSKHLSLECPNCNKVFKRKAGLTKHSKHCLPIPKDEALDEDIDNTEADTVNETSPEFTQNVQDEAAIVVQGGNVTRDLIVTMMKYMNESEKKHGEHMEMMQKQLEDERNQCKMLMNTVNDMLPRIGNFNNNNINVNVFLQERCKDALNLKDFVDSLRIELNDISKYQDRSMIDALGNVFINGLRQLDLYKRPIHCTDLSRETLYIKDDDAWENDSSNRVKLHSAITAVAAKQSKVLQEWERQHPNWSQNEQLTNEYLRLVRAITSPIEKGSTDENKIIHNIAKEVVVDLNQIEN
jgi:ribosomal protein L13